MESSEVTSNCQFKASFLQNSLQQLSGGWQRHKQTLRLWFDVKKHIWPLLIWLSRNYFNNHDLDNNQQQLNF